MGEIEKMLDAENTQIEGVISSEETLAAILSEATLYPERKITSGTVTVSSNNYDKYDSVSIRHGLGEKPKVIILYKSDTDMPVLKSNDSNITLPIFAMWNDGETSQKQILLSYFEYCSPSSPTIRRSFTRQRYNNNSISTSYSINTVSSNYFDSPRGLYGTYNWIAIG